MTPMILTIQTPSKNSFFKIPSNSLPRRNHRDDNGRQTCVIGAGNNDSTSLLFSKLKEQRFPNEIELRDLVGKSLEEGYGLSALEEETFLPLHDRHIPDRLFNMKARLPCGLYALTCMNCHTIEKPVVHNIFFFLLIFLYNHQCKEKCGR
ncbi:hypothetical protein EV1_032582 [Malus domestica]